MKKKILMLELASLVLISCSGISGEIDTSVPTSPTEENTPEQAVPSYSSLVNKTTPYPVAYEQEAKQRGQVVELQYTTRDYTEGTSSSRNNTANVYLPYGYDATNGHRYNILYLVHGHYGNASTFLTTDEGLLRKVLDNMIEQGDIDPLIVVTPTYNYGPPPNYVDADKFCRALPQEMQHDLIPLVENRYRTYALTTDSSGLAASRNHLAIGGFSMGGVTTWYAFDQVLSMSATIFL